MTDAGFTHSESDSLNQNDKLAVIASAATPDISGSSLPLDVVIGKPNTFSANHWLARPRLMYTYTNTGSMTAPIFQTPINDYFSDNDILYKTKYMSLFRGTAVYDFVFTASPYACGQIVVATFMDTFANMNASTVDPTLVPAAFVTKNHIIIDAGTNNTAQIRQPLTGKNAYLNIANGLDINISLFNMGVCTLTNIVNTQDGTNVAWTLRVYLSFEDTDLCIPTGQGQTAVYSMMEKTMTKDGPVSFPASVISSIGKTLSNVPIIGPFAYATSMIAEGVANIASLFGFSRPKSLMNRNFPHDVDIASYAGELEVKTITLDPMQEIPIDSSFLGDNIDPLSFKNIICREGLVAYGTWSTSNTSLSTLISCRLPVTPSVCVPAVANCYSFSPLAYGSQMFSLWRGTIKYRYVVPANRFVRGKLRILWNPGQIPAGFASGDWNQTSQNAPSVMLDLSMSSEVTIEVPYANLQSYCPIFMPGTSLTAMDPTQTGYNVNGYLYVVVEEPLIAQAASLTLSVLIYMSAGDDFEMQIPNTTHLQYIRRELYNASYSTHTVLTPSTFNYAEPALASGPQVIYNDLEYNTYTMMSNENQPVLQTSFKLLPFSNTSDVAINYMGEKFLSFRPALKRFYTYYNTMDQYTQGYSVGPWGAIFLPYLPIEPLYQTISSTYYYPPFLMTPVRYISNLFYGVRGSIRYRFTPYNVGVVTTTTEPLPISMQVSRNFLNPYTFIGIIDHKLSWLFARSVASSGEASFLSSQGEPVVFEVPHQFVSQYIPTLKPSYTTTSYGFQLSMQTPSTDNPTIYGEFTCAAGEDFNPVIWNGVPIVSMFPPGGTPS